METALIKIWDLKGELTKNLLVGNYKEIPIIKEKYEQIIKDNKKYVNKLFVCYHHAFWTEEEKLNHINVNIDSILQNIKAIERKFCEKQSTEETKFSYPINPFLAGELWVLREMYDKFVYIASKDEFNLNSQENMILGEAIIERLYQLLNKDLESEIRNEIRKLDILVRSTYRQIYGKSQPKVGYSQVVQDFIQK